MRCFGLDLSMCSTGVASWIHGQGNAWRIKTAKKDGHDIGRRDTIAEAIYGHVIGQWVEGERMTIVIEAVPTHGAFAIAPLAMLQGVVLDRLDLRGLSIYNVPGPVLKKYATGSGRADKVQMIAAAQACGYEGKNDDEADAWLLCLFARHLAGSDDHLTPQRASCLMSAQLVLGALPSGEATA